MTDNPSLLPQNFKIPSKPIDPIGSVLGNLPMIAVVITTCLLLGITAVFLKVKPSYMAEAIIKIEPVIPKILYGKEEASITPYYDDFVNTEINIVKNYQVLSKALETYEEDGFKWILPEEAFHNGVGRLTGQLNVVQRRGTQLFSISMFSRKKEGLAELINAVVNAYLSSISHELLNKDISRLSFLKKRKDTIEKLLIENYAVLQKMSAKYAVGITDEKNIYVYLQAIVDLTQQLVKATSKRIQVESKLKELEKQKEALKKLDISADIDEWVEQDWSIRDNRIQLSRKLQDMRLILAGVKKNHPDRKEYEDNLEKLYEVQENLIKRARKVSEKVIRGKLLSDQNKKILELQTDYAAALSTEKKLKSELMTSEKKATDVNTQMMKASTLRKEVQRLQDSLLRIDGRIDEIEVESRSPGRIILISKARPPEEPSGNKKPKLIIIVTIFSLAAGIGYSIIRDKLDDKIHSTHDISRVLGFPATGHIMESGQDFKKLNSSFSALIDTPFSQLGEQFKDIAFALSREQEHHKSNIFTCFSLMQGQGTSTFITNTLIALKGPPQKKLLLDLNIWNPVSRFLFPNAKDGLWEVLEGERDLKEVIVTNSKYPFHILPFGNGSKKNKSLFQEIGLESMIEALRLDYDYIMIDSPPFFLTTDSKMLASLADVVLLIVRAHEVTESELFRAVKLLDKINIKVVSVVLNRVMFQRGKYYKKTMEKYYSLTNPSNEERPS